MVAPGVTSSPPLAGKHPGQSVRDLGYGPLRFKVTNALSMVEQGIIPEDSTVELLDGSLIYRDRFDLRGGEVSEGVRHNFVISALADLAPKINDARRHLRTQSTLVCSDTHAPIPDCVVVRGVRLEYRDRLPVASDAFCVVEVADSSHERDSGEKLQAYARAGVEQYVIINLRNRTAEIYIGPEVAAGAYAQPRIVLEDQILNLRVGDAEFYSVRLADLLP
jgi:Uma2 family endonuclease